MKSSKPVGFSATIYKIGINPAVGIPEEVSRAFGKRGYVPVKGSLNGTPIRATLVPVGGGRHRLYINTEMRRRAKVDTGDKVQLFLDNDTEPRIFPVPKELSEALNNDKEAKDIWDELPKSERNEILAYLNWIKRPETLQRNIGKLITRHLKKERKKYP